MDESIQIPLTKDEAIVLLEFLMRVNDKPVENLFEDQSEQRVLWDIECVLEKQVFEVLISDYEAQVEQARGRVRDVED